MMRVALSLLCAGVLYAMWLAVFVPAMLAEIRLVAAVGWVTAPVTVALGLAVGAVVFDRTTGFGDSRLRSVFRSALVACVGGAILAWPFGLALTVAGMFGAGTIMLLAREIVQSLRNPQT